MRRKDPKRDDSRRDPDEGNADTQKRQPPAQPRCDGQHRSLRRRDELLDRSGRPAKYSDNSVGGRSAASLEHVKSFRVEQKTGDPVDELRAMPNQTPRNVQKRRARQSELLAQR